MKRLDVDKVGERMTRRLASHLSRRSALARLGALLVAAPAFPLLPVQRGRAADAATDFSRAAQTHDESACNYWRYCGMDGNLCACCGGGPHSCPAGSQPSPTSWIGSCFNPDDRRAYLIAYRDCCGANACPECGCTNTDHAMPIYRPQANGQVTWCFGTQGFQYHCSLAVLVGPAE